MARKPLFDRAEIADLIDRQDGVITRRQLTECGMSANALQFRIRPGGPWRVLLPGVYLAANGAERPEQRLIAAILFGRAGCVITGPAALTAHGVPMPFGSVVDVLVPTGRRRQDASFVRLHPTTRMPATVYPVGLVRYAPPARAVADAARYTRDLAEARTIVGRSVQLRKVRIKELADELARGPINNSAGLRAVLAEVADGIRSAAEGNLRDLIKRTGLPDPIYNPRLYLDGVFLASPDAWWPDCGVAVEVDSREWHLSPVDWQRTMARHSRMTAQGIVVLHYPPSRLTGREGKAVAAEIRSALAANQGRGARLVARLRTEAAA